MQTFSTRNESGEDRETSAERQQGIGANKSVLDRRHVAITQRALADMAQNSMRMAQQANIQRLIVNNRTPTQRFPADASQTAGNALGDSAGQEAAAVTVADKALAMPMQAMPKTLVPTPANKYATPSGSICAVPVQRKLIVGEEEFTEESNPEELRKIALGAGVTPIAVESLLAVAADIETIASFSDWTAANRRYNHPAIHIPQPPSWNLGLDPKAFAWRKLVSEERFKPVVLGASRVIMHMDVRAHMQGTPINHSSDFPVRLYCVEGSKEIHAVNILGQGRQTELSSFLEMVGISRTKIGIAAQETATNVPMLLEKTLDIPQWKKNIHLSIMPISVALQIDNMSVKILRRSYRDEMYPHMILSNGNEYHVICDIRWANGVVVEHLLAAIQANRIVLASANLHGICGSLTPALGRGTMVAPRGRIQSLSPEHAHAAPVDIPRNDVMISGALYVMDHGHVTTIMQEDDDSLMRLLDEKQVHTLEMEAYHFAKALESMNHDGLIKIVFTVSDVMTSPHENLGNPEPHTEKSAEARHKRNGAVITAFGLGASRPYVPPQPVYTGPSTSISRSGAAYASAYSAYGSMKGADYPVSYPAAGSAGGAAVAHLEPRMTSPPQTAFRLSAAAPAFSMGASSSSANAVRPPSGGVAPTATGGVLVGAPSTASPPSTATETAVHAAQPGGASGKNTLGSKTIDLPADSH